MIKILKDFPEGVVAAVATGRVTRRDYDEILIPAVEAAFCHGRRFAAIMSSAVNFPAWMLARCG